ncbi:MAG TPA: thiamine phosphate synthase [Methylomirabilota bacterium]|nr:thiamine phosphate synthase [Methylomirabilota bacterium]
MSVRPPLDLYVILDPGASGGRDLVALADAVLAAGARWLQLRAKETTTRELTALARRLAERARAAGGVLIVNDRLDVALAVGAAGVHLGQADLPASEARRLAPGLVLGVSSHGLEQARRAQAGGADYVALGSIYPTGSKPSFELVGLEALRLVRPHVTVPLVAIGGITLERVPAVLAAGADAVAVISAIGLARDPGEATAAFLAAIRQRRGAR